MIKAAESGNSLGSRGDSRKKREGGEDRESQKRGRRPREPFEASSASKKERSGLGTRRINGRGFFVVELPHKSTKNMTPSNVPTCGGEGKGEPLRGESLPLEPKKVNVLLNRPRRNGQDSYTRDPGYFSKS